MSKTKLTSLPKTARPIQSFPDYWACADGFIYSTKGKCPIRLSETIDKKTGYRKVCLSDGTTQRTKKVASLVAEAFYGIPEETKVVDHIDRVRTNDKPSNLRYLTPKENSWNRESKGVFYRPANKLNGWEAAIMASGVYHYLGSYKTEEEAKAAYRSAKMLLHNLG